MMYVCETCSGGVNSPPARGLSPDEARYLSTVCRPKSVFARLRGKTCVKTCEQYIRDESAFSANERI